MGHSIRDNLDSQALGISDCIFAGATVAHDAGNLDSFGYPAAIVLTFEF